MTLSIGLLGGSFNPPHAAHLALARVALMQLRLTRVDLMPAGQPWQKSGVQLASAEHRLAMCHAAIDGERGMGVEPCETQRTGNTYTVDTLRFLTQEHPSNRYTLIIGADQARRLDTWHDWQGVLQLCRLAVVARNDVEPILPPAVTELFTQPSWHFDTLHLPAMDVSSSAIRAQILEDKPISNQVSPAVERYIVKHSLYKTT
jgi:nicotinate-nucleotide adenylyltransferase